MKVSLISLVLYVSPGLLPAATPADVSGTPAIDELPLSAGDNTATQAEPATTQESAQREVEASEVPMAEQEATTLETPEPSVIREKVFDVYGSLRLRLRNSDDSFNLTDGGSRIGVDAEYPMLPRIKVFGRAEVGFNLLSELDLLDAKNWPPEDQEGNSFFKRLLYAGFETPGYFLVYGKNWSAYYKVADFTDRFAGTGGMHTVPTMRARMVAQPAQAGRRGFCRRGCIWEKYPKPWG